MSINVRESQIFNYRVVWVGVAALWMMKVRVTSRPFAFWIRTKTSLSPVAQMRASCLKMTWMTESGFINLTTVFPANPFILFCRT